MEQKDSTGTINKALDVLFFLHENGQAQAQGVTAIARALDMPKSSVHRLLATLLKRGLVEQNVGGRYQVGFALIALGLGALEREPVVVTARPVLEAKAAELGETFFLVVARGGQLVVVDKAEGSGFLRASPRLGTTVPIHATAVGKLYLAFGQDPLTLEEELTAFTGHTPVTEQALEDAINQAQQQGWASNLDEWIAGLSVLAAPVLLGERMVAAVAVALASARLTELGIDSLRDCVVSAAQTIAQRLEGKVQ